MRSICSFGSMVLYYHDSVHTIIQIIGRCYAYRKHNLQCADILSMESFCRRKILSMNTLQTQSASDQRSATGPRLLSDALVRNPLEDRASRRGARKGLAIEMF